MIAAVCIAVPSIIYNNQAGLGFAGGLTTAAGTAWQDHNRRNDDDLGQF